MTDDTLNSVFLKSIDQHERSVRWCYVVLLILLVFQLMIFRPFIPVHRDFVHSKAAVDRVSVAKEVFAKVRSGLEALSTTAPTQEEIDKDIDRFLADLIGRFRVLNDYVGCVRSKNQQPISEDRLYQLSLSHSCQFQETSSPRGSGNHESSRLSSMAVQREMTPQVIGGAPRREPPAPLPDTKLTARLMQVTNRDELLEAIGPFVEEYYIDPFFNQIIGVLSQPKLAKAIEDMLAEIRAHEGRSPEVSDQWSQLKGALQSLKSTADKRKIDNKYWWSTTSGKGETVEEIKIDFREYSEARPVVSSAIRRLSDEVNLALDRQKRSAEVLEDKLGEIEEQFKSQQEQLASIGAPFKFLALDLTFVARNFPLLLALILAAMIVWTTQRVADVGRAAQVIRNRGSEHEPWNWFVMKQNSSLIGLLSNLYVGTRGVRQFRWNVVLFDCVLVGIISLGWIAISAWQLARGVLVDSGQILVLVLLGGSAVVVALLYKWFVISALFRRLEQ